MVVSSPMSSPHAVHVGDALGEKLRARDVVADMEAVAVDMGEARLADRVGLLQARAFAEDGEGAARERGEPAAHLLLDGAVEDGAAAPLDVELVDLDVRAG